MARLEPVLDEPAAIVRIDGDRALVIADFHAGIESAFRREGVEIRSRAGERRERLERLLASTRADRLIVLGDLMHSIGGPGGPERGELEVLFESTISVPTTIVKGNHDGEIERFIDRIRTNARRSGGSVPEVTVTETTGTLLGDVGVVHGHTWPTSDVLSGDLLCIGHEHPCVRLVDEVGGARVEPAWLRGPLRPEPFEARGGPLEGWRDPELIVVPAFNDLVGGTWINVEGQEFLSPFLPDALENGEAYLLDGTRLGSYENV